MPDGAGNKSSSKALKLELIIQEEEDDFLHSLVTWCCLRR